jgi:Tfp pilus assembly protein PilF/peroxiredoxin
MVIGFTMLGLAILSAAPASAFRNVQPGGAIPPFSLGDLSDATKGQGDFSGKTKLFVFVSGNDRSRKVLGEVMPLLDKYRGEGLEVIGVYTGTDKAEAKKMAEDAKIGYPLLLDLKKEMYGAWGISVLPVMAFVSREDTLLKEQSYVPLLAGILEIEAQVALGKMSREEADLKLKPEDAPTVSDSEKEAKKIYELGLVLLERGMKDKAIEKFQKVIEIDPAFCAVRLQLGQIYLDDNKVDLARAEFEYILKCDPNSHEAKVGMGTVFGLKGDFDKALEILQAALPLNPRPELAHFEMGKVYEKKGQLDKAVESYKKALERLLTK